MEIPIMQTIQRFIAPVICLFLTGATAFGQKAGGQEADKSRNDFFESKVAPLLIKRCIDCHNSIEQSGGLDLTNQKAFRAGGDSEEGLANPDLDSNLLIEKIESGEMPPEEKGHSRELKEEEKAVVRQWIKSGANWPAERKLDLYEFTSEVRGGRDWWSFQPITRPKVPRYQHLENPIDAFVHEKHLTLRLGFNPPASKARLFRRAAYDTTGLPPSRNELIHFENSREAKAYESYVDRLLSSPRFGEHQARDWLDLIRYGDTNGYERDAEKPNAWKYRDWVVESINSDKPYDTFVLQQLAGDQMEPVAFDNVVGTTMLRVGTWDDEPNDKLEYKYDRLEDLIHVTSTAFLGLTVKCARCHNHKFDPIPQADYYRFGSVFWPGDLMGNRAEKVKGFEVFSWHDENRNVEPIRLLKKGNPRQPLGALRPGFLSVVKELDTQFAKSPGNSPDTNRRLEFAKRLVDKRNPLVARVIVNRIWQHYFGHGIVRTPNNFGYKGDLPTHPRLLDWLASELIANGWNLKPIHRLILTSRTYQQDSVSIEVPEHYARVDPLNRYLWRMNRKRLSAEAIRDTMLVHSGEINFQMGGRGFTPDVSEDALEGLSKRSSAWQPSLPSQQSRRGIYLFVKRSLIPPILTSFDFADTTRPCGKRDLTIVAPQALALLNNRFVHQQSERFANRIMTSNSYIDDIIKHAWNIAFARDPSKSEVAMAKEHFLVQSFEFSRLKYPRGGKSKVSRFPSKELVLHLDAERGVTQDSDHRVNSWKDVRNHRKASATGRDKSPGYVAQSIDGKPAITFNGVNQFLELNDQVLDGVEFTIILVGHDENNAGHREFFSNWNANGNSTSSVFLGLTDGRRVRFSDQFRTAGSVTKKPFMLTAVSRENSLEVFVGRQLIGKRDRGLTGRNLKTKYVIGTQGNFGHEFQKGWLAELMVFNQGLSKSSIEAAWKQLEKKYPSIKTNPVKEERIKQSPELLAFASLCHVLLNSNELIFVD